jgi:hypothetical protein
MASINTMVCLPLQALNVYARVDEETVVTVDGDMVTFWNLEGDLAYKIGGISKGNSDLSINQLIERGWGKELKGLNHGV